MIRFIRSIGFLVAILIIFSSQALAADFNKDLSISQGDVGMPTNLILGQTAKIYVTVHNNSKYDLTGVVKFFDEKTNQYVGNDQPFSALAGKTDDVFVEWSSGSVTGDHPIAIRVVPWDEKGDNPDNNKVTRILYVDIDTDGDGQANRLDSDDDNDGTPDNRDAFPLDPHESKDTDHDRLGDNADPDDDGDGVPDAEDAFPLDPTESKDSDGDTVGDNKDAFPLDPTETADQDQDGTGDNADPNDQNHSPIPVIQASTPEISIDQPVTFNALKSNDPDDSISTYEWDFGDGSKAASVIVDHSFKKPGRYLVTLKTTDSRGESKSEQMQVVVKSGWVLPALLGVSILLALMLLGLFIPQSKFYYRKLFPVKRMAKKK